MAIRDAQLMYSDAQALTATAVSTNIIDHGADVNVGLGEPMAVVITIDVASHAATTVTAVVQTDDNAAFSSATTLASSNALVAADMTAGAQIVVTLPQSALAERYTRISYTVGGATQTVTLTAFLAPLHTISVANIYYADAITIG